MSTEENRVLLQTAVPEALFISRSDPELLDRLAGVVGDGQLRARGVVVLRVGEAAATPRAGPEVFAFGRLAPGATIEQARAQIASVAGSLETEYPETNRLMGAGLGLITGALNKILGGRLLTDLQTFIAKVGDPTAKL